MSPLLFPPSFLPCHSALTMEQEVTCSHFLWEFPRVVVVGQKWAESYRVVSGRTLMQLRLSPSSRRPRLELLPHQQLLPPSLTLSLPAACPSRVWETQRGEELQHTDSLCKPSSCCCCSISSGSPSGSSPAPSLSPPLGSFLWSSFCFPYCYNSSGSPSRTLGPPLGSTLVSLTSSSSVPHVPPGSTYFLLILILVLLLILLLL